MPSVFIESLTCFPWRVNGKLSNAPGRDTVIITKTAEMRFRERLMRESMHHISVLNRPGSPEAPFSELFWNTNYQEVVDAIQLPWSLN